MSHMANPTDSSPLDAELVDQLLELPTLQAQASFLRNANLINPAGLAAVLVSGRLAMGSDPDKARQLALICEGLGEAAGAIYLIPRARYLRAQAHAMNAEFDTALQLIESACVEFAQLNEPYEAARTNVGRMFVLQELGRYTQALEAGESVREFLAESDTSNNNGEINIEENIALAARVAQNLGLCYELTGKYEQALAAYADAEAGFEQLGVDESLADVRNNRGVVLLSLGRVQKALAIFEQALTIFDAAQLTLKAAQTRGNIGNAYLLLGNYKRALATFEQVRQSLETQAAQSQKQILLLDLAEAYLSLNLYEDALAMYREVNAMLESSGVQHDRARALWGWGTVLVALGQFDEAERVLGSAALLFEVAGNTPMHALVLLRQAAMETMRGRRGVGLTKAREALRAVDGVAWPLQRAYAHLVIADLVLPDMAQAEFHLKACQDLASHLDLPDLHYSLNQRQGHLALITGNHVRAVPLLRTAIDHVEQLRSNVFEDRMRISLVTNKVAAYDDLVRLYMHQDLKLAFETTERAKARGLVALLSKTKAHSEPMPASQTMQLRSAQLELNTTYSELMGNVSADVGKRSLSELQSRAIELEREISRLQLQINSANQTMTGGEHLPLDTQFSFDELQKKAPPNGALVSYYICDETIFVFVVTPQQIHLAGSHATGIGSTAQLTPLLQRLGTQWERFRAGKAFAERYAAQLEQSTQRILAALYEILFKPIESLVKDLEHLIVIPHGLLHQVPFHALFNGAQSRYIIDTFTLSYAPSVTVLALCQQQPPPASNKALVVGVADEHIVETEVEVEFVSRTLNQPKVLINEQATIQSVQEQAVGCSIVHLACHGVFRAGNPMFSSLKLHDGWLLALDAMRLDLRGALVTLSACESGRSQALSGDEIVGLVRAFLGAGAASLVVSLWLAQDETTAELMRSWYKHMQSGGRRIDLLRKAQLELKAQRPHPYYWAPFIAVGQY